VKFGIQVRPTTAAIGPAELGRLVEGLGFDSLWFPEHTHMPLDFGPGVEPPGDVAWVRTNAALFDPFVALAAVAAVTERLLLGTGVCLLPQHDPIVLAKVIATLDVISRGRVLFGIGAGWNAMELRHHGTAPRERFQIMRERVLAMRAIWTSEVAEYHGRFVDFAPSYQWPKPVQRPYPPVLIGGEGPRVLERVLDYGDAWLPNEHDGVIERVHELQRLAAERGRAPIPVTIYSTGPDPVAIERYAAAGVERCVFTVPNEATGSERISAVLCDLAALMRAFEAS
jgi:probable F420-dependent oxidoreductase